MKTNENQTTVGGRQLFSDLWRFILPNLYGMVITLVSFAKKNFSSWM